MGMSDLVKFLNARLVEDEQVIRACMAEVGTRRAGQQYEDGSGVCEQDEYPSYPYASQGAELAFMARFHPDAMLADVEAKRRIVKRHFRRRSPDWDYPGHIGFECAQCTNEFPCPTLAMLALPFAEHPDYRPEWAV